MLHHLLNSSLILFVLWLFYKLALENTSWHHFKRWYLLASLVIAVMIPFIVVKTVVIPVTPVTDYVMTTPQNTIETPIIQDATEIKIDSAIDWFKILTYGYLLGVIIMSYRFIKNYSRLQIKKADTVVPYSIYQLVLKSGIVVPHSFINRIFVSKKAYDEQLIPKEILKHEKAHLDQGHSYDLIIIELLGVFLWFHPLIYLLRYSIKLNHEFLADHAVLKEGIDTSSYQQLLLHYTQQNKSLQLAHYFSFPIIKKRFTVMKTKTSNTSLIIRSLTLIPVLAILIISCGKEETKFQEVEEEIEEIEIPEQNQKLIVVDANTTEGYLKINDEDYFYKVNDDQIDIYNKFGELQDFEKQGYTVSKEIIKEKEITEELGNLSAIEYINQHKEELNYYLRDDQIDADNAINIIEKVGQNGVEISPDSNGIMSIKILETNNNKKLLPPPPPPPPLTESGYIKVDDKIYYYTTKINDSNLYDRDGNVIDIKNKKIEQINKEDLPPPPPPAPEYEDLVKYNAWARKINAKNNLARESDNNDYAIVKMKDIEKYKAIYNRLTKTQKANAQPWPNFPPPPPHSDYKIKKKKNNTKAIKDGSWEDVKEHLKPRNPEMHLVGDAIQVMNLNRHTLKYQFDGKPIDAVKARQIIVDYGQRGVYLDTLHDEPTMVMQSKYFSSGPALPSENGLAGDGC